MVVTVRPALALALLTSSALSVACGLPPIQLPAADVDRVCEPSCMFKHEDEPADVGARLRFVALGDAGKPGDAASIQGRVATRVREVCAADASTPACAFAFLLGDNLYPAGIGNDDDRRKLGAIIESYGLPAYLVLGNHDWGPVRPTLSRARNELEWIYETDGVYGNAHFYDLRAGPAHVWALDTNYLVRRKEAASELEPAEWIQMIGQTAAPWRIAVGHHPYLSNGSHGNAGSFKDLWLVNWHGQGFKAFFDDHVLGNVDLYLAGHDHNLQFYARARDDGQRAAALVVAGSTAKCGGAGRAENGTQPGTMTPAFEYDGPGFALIDVTRERLTVELHRPDDRNRWLVWTATTTRGAAGWEHDAAWSDLGDHCRP